MDYSCKRPGAEWFRRNEYPLPVLPAIGVYAVELWEQAPLRVLSYVEVIDGLPRWHLSVAVIGGTRWPSAVEMVRVRRAFDMVACVELHSDANNTRHLVCPIPGYMEQGERDEFHDANDARGVRSG